MSLDAYRNNVVMAPLSHDHDHDPNPDYHQVSSTTPFPPNPLNNPIPKPPSPHRSVIRTTSSVTPISISELDDLAAAADDHDVPARHSTGFFLYGEPTIRL